MLADLHELLCVLVELLQDGQCLFRQAMLQDALDDSAAVRVSGQGEHLMDNTQLHVLYICHVLCVEFLRNVIREEKK